MSFLKMHVVQYQQSKQDGWSTLVSLLSHSLLLHRFRRSTHGYAHYAVLDGEEKMKLFWTVDWNAETVSFTLEAATTEWVGFGFFTGSGQTVDSDVVIGWVKDNQGYLTVRILLITLVLSKHCCFAAAFGRTSILFGSRGLHKVQFDCGGRNPPKTQNKTYRTKAIHFD